MDDITICGMATPATYSLRILLATIAGFAIAAGAFAAPPSLTAGFLVLILATCGPGLLVVIWQSGGGCRRSFVIGATAPCVVCAFAVLRIWVGANSLTAPTVPRLLEFIALTYRSFVLTFLTVALGGGLLGMAVHWLMAEPEADADAQINTFP